MEDLKKRVGDADHKGAAVLLDVAKAKGVFRRVAEKRNEFARIVKVIEAESGRLMTRLNTMLLKRAVLTRCRVALLKFQ